MSQVSIIMGSDSDLPVMQHAVSVLKELGVKHEVHILSAHRTPERTHAYVRQAEEKGCKVFIAAAGMAAHLAGTIAALTLRPVIGVPMDGSAVNGLDALLSTVQMPGGVPVGCMAIGKAGAVNAAHFAAQMLALEDERLFKKIQRERATQAKLVYNKDKKLQQELKNKK